MFTAAAFFTAALPKSIFDEVMALPYHIYVLATAGTHIEQTRPLQYGTALVLVALVLGIDLIAILMQKFHEKEKKVVIVEKNVIIKTRNVDFFYGSFRALTDVTMDFEKNRVTALIGPSGCGKSTLLRLLNRMNDLIDGTRVEGEILFEGQNIYAPDVDPVEIRRRIGMVFQKPNPFPKSIFNNITYAPKLSGIRKQERSGSPR